MRRNVPRYPTSSKSPIESVTHWHSGTVLAKLANCHKYYTVSSSSNSCITTLNVVRDNWPFILPNLHTYPLNCMLLRMIKNLTHLTGSFFFIFIILLYVIPTHKIVSRQRLDDLGATMVSMASPLLERLAFLLLSNSVYAKL